MSINYCDDKKIITQKINTTAQRTTLCAVLSVAGFLTVVTAGAAHGQDRFSLTLGSKELWDSNFARSAEVDSEHYTHSTAAIELNQRFSKQDLTLGLSGNRVQHAQREDLDVNFYEGNAGWRSDWSTKVKTAFAWQRNAYAVDRLEFSGKDVVARENLSGQFTLGGSKGLGFTLGARQIAQTHSNEEREYLNYDDEEGFVAGTYTTANGSFISLRLREGERTYDADAVRPLVPIDGIPDSVVPGEIVSLDFDYRHIEAEGSWALTRKTQLGFTLGRFKRDGEINAGTGSQALVDLDWAVSEKLKLSLSYSHSEPAIGETTDSPADVRASKFSLSWQPSEKWNFSMGAGYSTQTYVERLDVPAREERITTFSPFALTYRFSDMIKIRMDSHWVDRESPLIYRDYDYAQASLGINFVF